MEYRKSSYWADSITSIMRKTEMNLHRIQTPLQQLYEEQSRPATSAVYQSNDPSDIRSRPRTANQPEDSPIEPNYMKTHIEKIVTDFLKFQRHDINSINDRLAILETSQAQSEANKENFQKSLNAVENKCLAETRRLEETFRGFVTQDDLKIVEESVKNTHLYQIAQVELDFKDLRSELHGIKEEAFIMVENRLRELAKSMINPKEILDLKNEVIRETAEKINEIENKISQDWQTLQNFNSETVEMYEKKFRDFNDVINDRIDDENKDWTKKIATVKNSITEECGKLKSEIQRLENEFSLGDIEYEIGDLRKQFTSLQKSVGNFASKQDLEEVRKSAANSQPVQIDTENLVEREEINEIIKEINKRLEEGKLLQIEIKKELEGIEMRIIELENESSGSEQGDFELIAQEKKTFQKQKDANPFKSAKAGFDNIEKESQKFEKLSSFGAQGIPEDIRSLSDIKPRDSEDSKRESPVLKGINIPDQPQKSPKKEPAKEIQEIKPQQKEKPQLVQKMPSPDIKPPQTSPDINPQPIQKSPDIKPQPKIVENPILPPEVKPQPKAAEAPKIAEPKSQPQEEPKKMSRNDLLAPFIQQITKNLFNTELEKCFEEVALARKRSQQLTQDPYSSYKTPQEEKKLNISSDSLKNIRQLKISPNHSFASRHDSSVEEIKYAPKPQQKVNQQAKDSKPPVDIAKGSQKIPEKVSKEIPKQPEVISKQIPGKPEVAKEIPKQPEPAKQIQKQPEPIKQAQKQPEPIKQVQKQPEPVKEVKKPSIVDEILQKKKQEEPKLPKEIPKQNVYKEEPKKPAAKDEWSNVLDEEDPWEVSPKSSSKAPLQQYKQDPWSSSAKAPVKESKAIVQQPKQELGEGLAFDTGSSIEINDDWNLGFSVVNQNQNILASKSPQKPNPVKEPPKPVVKAQVPPVKGNKMIINPPNISDSESDKISIEFDDLPLPF
ncbi:unnamed protein product [Blepharisma stoltei]|uniref:Uncharacterized protein n=1 Tax=Blepharisma stoltei TaxID=1481888 RepID=A0AAU9IM13_9CILI|nr:unnamed protein product [Blepharisma stoltei]